MAGGRSSSERAGRILLTGPNGFLGSVLWRRFLQEGYYVAALKRSCSDMWRVADLIEDSLVLNVDHMACDEVFREVQPDVVVHTACLYGRRNESVSQLTETNLLYPLGLLDECAKQDVFLINTASLLPPQLNPYALSKHQFEQWLDFYAFDVSSVSLKFDHLYGPGDDSGRFVGWLTEQFLAGVSRIPLTAGEQTRDFLHLDDAAELFVRIAAMRKGFDGHNVFEAGACKEIRMKDFVLLLAHLWEEESGKSVVERLDFGALPYRNGEVMRTVVPELVLEGVPWQAQVGLEEGLREYVRWRLRSLQ